MMTAATVAFSESTLSVIAFTAAAEPAISLPVPVAVEAVLSSSDESDDS